MRYFFRAGVDGTLPQFRRRHFTDAAARWKFGGFFSWPLNFCVAGGLVTCTAAFANFGSTISTIFF